MLARLALIVPFLAACGGSDGNPAIDAPAGGDGAGSDAPVDMPPTGFTLTSQMITNNGTFPAENTCSSAGNVSPQLSWVNAPAGTMSFAVVLTDLDVGAGLLHWIIYDIPLATTSLGADVDKVFQPPDVAGASQTLSFDNQTRGYKGPCPPFPDTHHYQFDVYAVDQATLPNVQMNSTSSAVLVQIASHNKGHASLSATYKQP
jgi:Raf kinase inhibitor-like YbhB/YbcL family protein